jgi:outer membrane protein OmpA-like peptidoglycan-associated protein
MKSPLFLSILLVLGMLASFTGVAQLRDQGISMGVGAGVTLGVTDVTANTSQYIARGFLRYPLTKALLGEFGLGVGRVGGDDYKTEIIPIDYRFVFSPFSMPTWNPYVYAGGGAVHYSVRQLPSNPTATNLDSWAAFVPAGIGAQFKIVDGILFEVSGGYNYIFSKNINGITETKNDGYLSGIVGLTLYGESPNADPDGDGLTNAEEKQLGTNPKVADTDGDGLSDGDEVFKYKTNPLKADSDGDGLKDGEEVLTYKTDPNKADTDGDGLSDGDEILKYKTDPLKADTDGDGLNDGDEVMKYKTDPLKADTDGDGLNDGEEVMKYKTDPLKADTDGGTVNDGTEVARGTNPLDPSDDVPKPKKEELVVEAGKAIVLDGVVFETGKSLINATSESVLGQAYNTLAQNPEISVEIRGYTDNIGKAASNIKLSQARAEAVRAWLITKGISAERVTAKGFGPENPVAPNTTPEGKAKNRRIEFFRTK